MLEQGIVVVATGHAQYGRMAWNLAVSIKAVENFPVAVLYSGVALGHLTEKQLKVFDHKIPMDVVAGCGAKLSTYQYSPFKKTLVLDADMLWLPRKKPSELFTELDGVQFTGITEGDSDNPAGHYFFWANIDEIREQYKITGKVFQWRTEVMYFERSKAITSVFRDAIKIHKKPNLKTNKQFAGGVSDELAINIACAIHEVEPHVIKWQPSYWPKLHRGEVLPADQLYSKYYVFSAGGNSAPLTTQEFYNRLMKAQAPKIGQVHIFALQSKFSFLKEREKS